jgi:hypothetical protein
MRGITQQFAVASQGALRGKPASKSPARILTLRIRVTASSRRVIGIIA